jgi:hypothetical protein
MPLQEQLRINEDIPGQMSARELKAIAAVAKSAPERGKIVEIGSLFGRSSWTWAKNAHPSVTIYCIDPWQKNAGVRPLEEKHQVRYGLPAFEKFTAGCSNIVAKQGYSPRDFLTWSEEIDVFFDDAVHQDPVFSENLVFWRRFLKPSGIVCGHDYRPAFPDIVAGVNKLAASTGRDLVVVESFWCLLPRDRSDVSLGLRSSLSELAGEWSKLAYYSQQEINIDTIQLPSSTSRVIEIIGTLQNRSTTVVDVGNGSREPLRIGVRFYAVGVSAKAVIEGRASINVDRIEPAQSIPFHLRVDFSRAHPGRYRAVVDLVKEHCFWAGDLSSRIKRIEFDFL